MYRKDRGRSIEGHATVPLTGKTPDDKTPTVYTNAKTFELLNERDRAGDGTVPGDSGRALERLVPPPKETFCMAGMDHQHCFDVAPAVQAAIYGIARIIQEAPPPTPPQSAPPPGECAPG
jgi:hypothetical protein